MERAIEYLKQHKKTLLITVLLAAFIILAVALFGANAKTANATVDNANRTDEEVKLMRILSEIDGVGQAEVMINEGKNGVEGVVIVCEGANSITTRNDVINAVATALNVNRTNIAIYAMNK